MTSSRNRRKPDLVVVATSARMLAALARAAGYAPAVVDVFGDDDTRALAHEYIAVPARADYRLGANALRAALAMLRARHGPLPVVCGGGLEHLPALLDHIARQQPLVGTGGDVYRRLADAPALWGRLARTHGVTMPSTRWIPPRTTRGWLVKRSATTGGAHVRMGDAPARRGDYYQRFVSGRSVSALLLADRTGLSLLGMAEHLCWRDAPRAAAWRYEGARSIASTPRAWSGYALRAARAVQEALALRGCFGLDFIARDDGALALVDINPRPPATLELHAQAADIFAAHVRACTGGAPWYGSVGRKPSRAHVILYADASWSVPARVRWPEWVSDRPAAHSRIPRGAPLFTVHAEAHDDAAAVALLAARCRALHDLPWQVPPPYPAALNIRTRGGSDHVEARAGLAL